MTHWLLIVALVGVGIPAVMYAYVVTHLMLGRLCVRHAQRFCRRNGWEFRRARWQPEFEPSGVKTEFTLVQLAERRRQIDLIAARQGADRVKSEAQAEADADKIRSIAAKIRAEVEAEGVRLMNEARNVLSPQASASVLRMRLLEKVEGIVRESVKPLERIEVEPNFPSTVWMLILYLSTFLGTKYRAIRPGILR